MLTSMFNEDNVVIKTALSCWNAFVHILMGVTIAVPILFAVRKEFNRTSPSQDIIMLHIILGVLGYILLMPQALLSLSSYNTWSSSLNLTCQRRAHWILLLLGSGLAMGGSITMMVFKDINFETVHGKLGLSALVFTGVNLFTGLGALFSRSLDKFMPSYVIKLTHIILGIVAFACASSCLCYGFDKDIFRAWTNDRVTTGVIAITGIFTLIVLINPFVTLCKKITQIINRVRDE